MGAVFFTLVLLTGNTMAQSIRERIPELAVLKTIGFTNRAVLLLVLAEADPAAPDSAVCWAWAWRVCRCRPFREATGGQFDLTMQPADLDPRPGAHDLIGILVGLPPALKAMRLSIVDALAGR